jgi:mRNA-degrading endonuclease RelE of RelBE toxin-antitoxin system
MAMAVRIEWRKAALRELGRTPTRVGVALATDLGRWAENRAAAVDVKALQGEGGRYRLRKGDWRLLFSFEDDVIEVETVAPRGSAYD